MSEATHNKTIAFTVTCGSLNASQQSNQGVETFFLEEHLDMVGMAQITLRPNSNVSQGSFKIGDPVEINVSGDARKWVGMITGFKSMLVGNEAKFVILAMDPLCLLASSRHTRVWPPDGNNAGSEKVSDSDIFNEVAGAAGVQIGQVESLSPTRPYVFQRNESDLNFLKRLAARNGLFLRAVEGKVNFEKMPTNGAEISVDYRTAKALEYTWSPMWVPPMLKVHGYDYATKTRTKGEHSSFEAIGSGPDPVAYGNSKIWQKEAHVGDVFVATDAGAKTMAEAELERLGRGFLRGRAIIDGSGDLYPGQKVTFTGFKELNATAVIVSARHIVTTKPDDFRTEIHFASNSAPSS